MGGYGLVKANPCVAERHKPIYHKDKESVKNKGNSQELAYPEQVRKDWSKQEKTLKISVRIRGKELVRSRWLPLGLAVDRVPVTSLRDEI